MEIMKAAHKALYVMFQDELTHFTQELAQLVVCDSEGTASL